MIPHAQGVARLRQMTGPSRCRASIVPRLHTASRVPAAKGRCAPFAPRVELWPQSAHRSRSASLCFFHLCSSSCLCPLSQRRCSSGLLGKLLAARHQGRWAQGVASTGLTGYRGTLTAECHPLGHCRWVGQQHQSLQLRYRAAGTHCRVAELVTVQSEPADGCSPRL